jgi:hypothetical protein
MTIGEAPVVGQLASLMIPNEVLARWMAVRGDRRRASVEEISEELLLGFRVLLTH